MYEAQRHPASRADTRCALSCSDMGTKRKDAMHPMMEPMLPAKKGSIMPRMVFLIVLFDMDDDDVDVVVVDTYDDASADGVIFDEDL